MDKTLELLRRCIHAELDEIPSVFTVIPFAMPKPLLVLSHFSNPRQVRFLCLYCISFWYNFTCRAILYNDVDDQRSDNEGDDDDTQDQKED